MAILPNRTTLRGFLDQIENTYGQAKRMWVMDRGIPSEAILAGPMIPELVDEIFASIVIVKKRWVEAAAVEINRIRPVAVDVRTRYEIIVEIAQRRARCTTDRGAPIAFHVGVD